MPFISLIFMVLVQVKFCVDVPEPNPPIEYYKFYWEQQPATTENLKVTDWVDEDGRRCMQGYTRINVSRSFQYWLTAGNTWAESDPTEKKTSGKPIVPIELTVEKLESESPTP